MLGFLNTAMSTTTRRYMNIEMGRPGGDPNKIFNMLMVVHIVLAFVILFFAETIGIWYIYNVLKVDEGKLPDALFVFQVSTIVACMGIINLPFQSLIEANEKFMASSLIDIGTNLVKLGLVILLLFYKGNSLRFYAVSMSVVTFLSLLLYHGYCARRWGSVIKWKFFREKELYREIVSFNNWTALSAGAFIARTNGSSLLVNYFFGTFTNGAMKPAYDLENFSVMAMNRLSNAASPQITQNYGGGNTGRSVELVHKISRFSAMLMTLLVFTLLVELPFVLDIWLKKVPEGTAFFCEWTLISALVRSFLGGTQTLEQATGRIKWFHLWNTILSVSCLPLGYVAYMLGAAPVTIIQIYIGYSIVYRMVEFVLLHHLLGFNVGAFVREAYLRPLVVIAIMTGLLLAYRGLAPVDMGSLARLLVIGATAFICCALIFIVGMTASERATIVRTVQVFLRRGK